MNYSEAQKEIESLKSNPYTSNFQTYKVIVIPSKIEDVTKFLSDLKTSTCAPEDVQKYSSDNNFKIESYLIEFFK